MARTERSWKRITPVLPKVPMKSMVPAMDDGRPRGWARACADVCVFGEDDDGDGGGAAVVKPKASDVQLAVRAGGSSPGDGLRGLGMPT
ncbi:hypothetical protein PG984_001845 [Apiospora sp. TS-2023a]